MTDPAEAVVRRALESNLLAMKTEPVVGGTARHVKDGCAHCEALAALDALSARLAQAEQLAADMSNLAKIERAGREQAEARLREYEEALDKLVPDVRLLVIAYFSGTPDDLEAADAPASRLDAMLFDDDGAPRSVLAPKVADG